MTVKTLASNMAREAWHRSRRRAVPPNVEITTFDPFDPATAADPYPHYRELLAGGPVHYNRRRGIFILSRYADVRAAARADHALSSADGVTYGRLKLPVLLTTDAPKHTRMRKQAMPGFTRGALESWQPVVDQLARDLVARLLAQSPADVVSTLAVPMPMGMIAHILGIAQEDQSAFRKWSNDTVRVADINISRTGLQEIVPTLRGFRHLHSFFTTRLGRGELLGEDTVLGRLARHTEDGRLSFEEMFFIAVLLLLAGNETTTNMLSTLFLTLARRPDQLRLLRARPELIGSAIEEQLRFASPVQSFYRTTRVDYPVGQAVIPAKCTGAADLGCRQPGPAPVRRPRHLPCRAQPDGTCRLRLGCPSVPGRAVGPHGGPSGAARGRRAGGGDRGHRRTSVDHQPQPARPDRDDRATDAAIASPGAAPPRIGCATRCPCRPATAR